MFERFTEPARQAVVLAQDEARELRHNYIETEHILLGLLREEEGIAARVLKSLGVTLDETRVYVARIVGQGDELTTGQIPFTPRATKVLEYALREALSLGHDYIGTEHVLLGLAREGGGVAVHILVDLGATPRTLATAVVQALGGGAHGALYVSSFATEIAPSLSIAHTQQASAVVRAAHTDVPLVLGWVLLALGSALGLFVGWLIWG